MVHAGQAFREKEGQRVKEAWTAKDETNGVLDSDMKYRIFSNWVKTWEDAREIQKKAEEALKDKTILFTIEEWLTD